MNYYKKSVDLFASKNLTSEKEKFIFKFLFPLLYYDVDSPTLLEVNDLRWVPYIRCVKMNFLEEINNALIFFCNHGFIFLFCIICLLLMVPMW